jgi:hypothetical protein
MPGNQLAQRHVHRLALRTSPYQLLSFAQDAIVDLDVCTHTPKHTHTWVCGLSVTSASPSRTPFSDAFLWWHPTLRGSVPLMTKADEIVKARLAAQQISRATREAQARSNEIKVHTQYLLDAIPRLLALLEQRGYPDAELLNVPVPGPRRLFGRQRGYVEMAAWLLDEDRSSEGGSSVRVLSDGRLVTHGSGNQGGWGGTPVAIAEISTQYSEKGALDLLGRASEGVKRLIKRYEVR